MYSFCQAWEFIPENEPLGWVRRCGEGAIFSLSSSSSSPYSFSACFLSCNILRLWENFAYLTLNNWCCPSIKLGWNPNRTRLSLDQRRNSFATRVSIRTSPPGRTLFSPVLLLLPRSIGILPLGKLIFLTNLPFLCIYAGWVCLEPLGLPSWPKWAAISFGRRGQFVCFGLALWERFALFLGVPGGLSKKDGYGYLICKKWKKGKWENKNSKKTISSLIAK